jgi:hypothetical protein
LDAGSFKCPLGSLEDDEEEEEEKEEEEEEEEEMLNIRMSEQEYNDVTVHEYVGIR